MDTLAAVAQSVDAILRAQVESFSAVEAEEFVVAAARVIGALQARQSLAMAVLTERVEQAVAERTAEHPPPPGVPSPDPEALVASMLAPELHCATRTVRRRIQTDRWLTGATESTFSAHWDGDLDRPRAEAVVDAARTVSPALLDEFEARVLETSHDATTGELTLVSQGVRSLSRADLARRARSVARQLDPESTARAASRAHAERFVAVTPDRHSPGMARWTALVPADVSQQMFAAVDGLAQQLARSAPGTGLDAHRADALAALVRSRASIATTVELVLPVMPRGAAAGDAVPWVAAPVDDPRHGTLLPDAMARLLCDPDVTLRLARLDPDGSLVQDPRTYRPSASVARRVRSRDGGCRFPGCNTPARRSDLDHVVPWPRGHTDPANLICLCRTHHVFKHHGGWRVHLDADGTVTWSTPDGRTWVTRPRLLAIGEQLTAAGADPQLLHDLARGWHPGLPVGMSVDELLAAEQLVPPDPPESGQVPAPPPDWVELDASPAGPDGRVAA